MDRIGTASFALCLLAFTTPTRAAGPDIGREWGTPDLTILAIGDLSADPGLECVGRDLLASTGVYRLSDGVSLGSIPGQLNTPQTDFTLHDVDNDGLAEILCTVAPQPGQTRVGLLDLTGGLHRSWPDVIVDDTVGAADFMNLNPAEPQAIVLGGRQLSLLSSQTGALLYESDSDPGIGTAWRFLSMLIDDFDLDGYDEVLSHMQNQQTPSVTLDFLIGDRGVPTSAQGLSELGHVVLGQSWPNPANGSTRIGFVLTQDSRVRLRLFDAAGRLVRTIQDGPMPAGAHQRMWDGKDDQRASVASGIYFYELDVDGQRQTRKIVQVR
jgi:hypothetical protein